MRIEQGYFFAGLFCVRRAGSFCVKKQKRGCRSKGDFCMMQIKKLTLTHKKDLRVILEDFQLVLNDGDKAVIIGEEGNGKSTLLKWMYDPALTEDYIESTGERIIGKERLGYLPQELPEAEKTKTVYEYFYEKEKFWDQTPKDLAVLARKFGLTEEFFYRDQQMRNAVIDTQFHDLRIHHDQLHIIRMRLVQNTHDQRIDTYRLSGSCRSCHK